MYVTKIIDGHVASYILCAGGRAIYVSDQDYPLVCAGVNYVLEAEPKVYITKITQGLVAS